jgi:hypothetical protein
MGEMAIVPAPQLPLGPYCLFAAFLLYVFGKIRRTLVQDAVMPSLPGLKPS